MRHGMHGRKFGRNTTQRRALLAGLAADLIRHEQIRTTLAKAKDLRPYVEKLITTGRGGDLHAFRQSLAVLGDDLVVRKLTTTLADRYKVRAGGYTRIIKAGFRHGDNAPMAVIELMDRDTSLKASKTDAVATEAASAAE